MPKSPILGGFSTTRSPNASDSEAINIATEIIETRDGKVPGFLFGTSGLDLIMSVGSGPVRGILPLLGLIYVVSGPNVYSIGPTGNVVLVGTISAQASPVSMFANTQQLMIVDGVGAWLVPGGFPLAGGAISPGAPGGLYAPGDTITLLASSGNQSAYPVLTVTSTANTPVTVSTVVNAGTTYNTATAVATTAIQPQAGNGTGLTVNISSASGGIITGSGVGSGGTGYAVNDTGIIGGRDGWYRVTSVSAGVVTGFILLNPGSTYTVASGVSTQAAPGIANNLGSGFTLDITASAGPITASSINFGGAGFTVGNAGFISGGTGDATYLVNAVGPNGAVTGFSVTQAGAIDSPAASFTQKSTSGSGSGFGLSSPSYGSFLGLVPVSLPFANPMVGGVMDGFGLLVFLGQQVLACSAQGDLSTWPALNFGIANQSPDTNITLAINHDEAYILKTTNAEVWTNLGTPNFPFGPLGGVHMQSGCVAPFSVAVADEALIWLSRNSQGQGIVVMAKAYQVEPISTQAMVSEIQTYPQIGDAIAYVRQEGQHVFYVITFPQADKTWVYDKTASTQVGYPLWHRLAAFSNGTFKRHWGNCFYPWPQAIVAQAANASYQAQAVTITYPTKLQTGSGLNGLPTAFSSFVFSLWVNIPDSAYDSLYFSNQTDDTHGTTNPGLFINIQNDVTGTPQITIQLWDGSNGTILSATYNFTTWATWTNILISVNTTTQKIQVWASTLVSQVLVETQLTAASLTWSSNNAIGASATQPWHLALKNVP